MGAHLVRLILGPENDHTFGTHFCTDLDRFEKPTPKHKSRWCKNLGHETDGSHVAQNGPLLLLFECGSYLGPLCGTPKLRPY